MGRLLKVTGGVMLFTMMLFSGAYAADYGDQFNELDNITNNKAGILPAGIKQGKLKAPNVLNETIVVKGNFDMPGYTLVRSKLNVEGVHRSFSGTLLHMDEYQGAFNEVVYHRRPLAKNYCEDLVNSNLSGAEIQPVVDSLDVQVVEVTSAAMELLVTCNFKCYIKQTVY
ncbi:MAG: hypothetical protein AB7E96_09890 [Deferribacterales bacterium]